MNKEFVNFIVKKYLRYDKKNPFISISGILAFLGVSIGVGVLILSMTVMNGMTKEFKERLFTMNYPLTIKPKTYGVIDEVLLKKLEEKFPNLKFSPYISSEIMIQGENGMSGGLIFGVNPKKELEINKVYKKAIKTLDLKKFHIITGVGISDSLDLIKNDKVTLYFNQTSPVGFSSSPRIKRFSFESSFTSSLGAYDNSYTYTSLGALKSILRKPSNQYDEIHIYSDNAMEDREKIKKEINLNKITIIGWWEQNGNFFSAMELEKKTLFIVLMAIVLVASLNIISSLLMTVMSRRKEIALLLSLGASKKEVKTIFFRLGLIIGMSGIVFGVALGFFGIYILDNFDIIALPADVYGTSKIPLNLDIVDFVSILIGTLIIVILASYYPSHKASKIDELEVLRNE